MTGGKLPGEERACTAEPTPIIMTGGGGQMGTLEAFLSAMDGLDEPRGPLKKGSGSEPQFDVLTENRWQRRMALSPRLERAK